MDSTIVLLLLIFCLFVFRFAQIQATQNIYCKFVLAQNDIFFIIII